MALAATWESDAFLRNRGREKGYLTVWPNPQSTGVASMKGCALNVRVLEQTAEWWIGYCDRPAAIPIGMIRDEV